MNPKFKIGDEVERISGGEWFGMSEGDRGTVFDVIQATNNWSQIKIKGYGGIYSDFRFKLVSAALRDGGGET